MKNFKILKVKQEELSLCLETIHLAFSNNAKEYGFTKENYPSSGAFITLEDLTLSFNNGVHMYAAWIDGKVAGYVQLEKKKPLEYSFQKFAVLPQYQQLGIGKALIDFCINKALVCGAKKITLIMVLKNEKLKNFYLSNGFVLTKTKTDNLHPFLQGIMELNL